MALVAEVDGVVAGHILYFPQSMVLGGQKVDSVLLAIVGALPQLQKTGIGAKLVQAGMDIARKTGLLPREWFPCLHRPDANSITPVTFRTPGHR